MAEEKKEDYFVDIIEILALRHGELAAIRGITESYIYTDSDTKPVQKTLGSYVKSFVKI